MTKNNRIDITSLPPKAQDELFDFYLFLKQRYSKYKNDSDDSILSSKEAIERLLSNDKKRNIVIDSKIDISALANEINDVEIWDMIYFDTDDCIHVAIAEKYRSKIVTFNK